MTSQTNTLNPTFGASSIDVIDASEITLDNLEVQNVYSNAIGGLLKVQNVQNVIIKDSKFSNLRSTVSGGFGYFRNSQLSLTNSEFDTISGTLGGVLHLQDHVETLVTLNTFDNIQTTSGGGIIYTSHSGNINIDDNTYSTLVPNNINIQDCSFHNLTSSSISSGFFLTSYYLKTLTLQDVNFTNFTSVGSGGLFYITAIRDSVVITTSEPSKRNNFKVFANIGSNFGSSSGTLLFSTAPLLKLQIFNSLFQCSKTAPDFSNLSQAVKTSNVGQFAVTGAKSFYSESNTFRYCQGAAKGSIFTLISTTFQDVGSKIYQNSGNLGGVIAAVNSLVQLNKTVFTENYAYQGAVFHLQDNTTLKIYMTSISNNQAQLQGGVIFSENIDVSNFDQSNYYFTQTVLTNNSVTQGTGGLIFIDNDLANIYITDSEISSHHAEERGGLAFIQNLRNFYVKSSTLVDIFAKTEAVIFSIAENLRLQINETTITCNTAYDLDRVAALLESSKVQKTQSGSMTVQFAVEIKSYKSTFQQCGIAGQGGLFKLLSTTYQDQSSQFRSLSASQGGAFHLVQSTASFKNSIFHENLAEDAGVIYLSQSSYLLVQNSKFYNNRAFSEAGVIYIESGSYADISGSFVYNNQALRSSFMFALQTSNTRNVTLTNSEIYDNVAEANSISIVRGFILIQGCNFENNLAYQSSKNIFAGFSSLIIMKTTFRGVKNLNEKLDQTIGSAILVILDVQLVIQSSNFLNGYSQYGAAIYVSGEADVRMSGCSFSGNKAKISGGAIFASGYKTIQVDQSSVLINNIASDKGDDVYISNSQGFFNVINTRISNPKASLSIYAEYVSINMTQVTMSDISTQGTHQTYGSALQCINCYLVHIRSSTFQRLKSVYGGTFYFFESTQSKTQGSSISSTSDKYLIENSVFSNSQAVAGGAIYFDNVFQVNISNCEFSSNMAFNATSKSDSSNQGSGGAIYFECLYTDLNCQLKISGATVFKNNYASIQGGALHWTMIEPEFGSKVKYSNNIADVYGENISCFVQNIALINKTQYEQILRNFGKIRDDTLRNLQALQTEVGVSNQRSGGSIPDIYLCFVDKYGQIVTTDSDSKIRVSVNTQQSSQYLKYPFYPVIDGSQVFQLESGVTLASGIVLSATPGQSYSLVFTSDSIDQTKPSNKKYLQSQALNENAFQLEVNLRDCLVGEQYTSTGQCTSCPAGSSYSVIQMTSPGSCKECPDEKAYCNGGSNIGPKPGFWRSSTFSDDFISCQYYYACLGMVAPDYNPLGSCLTGYQGIICADCAPGYSRSTDYKCSSCPSEVTNFMRLLFIFIAAVIFVSVIVYTTLSGARQQKNVTNIFIKILMNHFQLIFLTASFNLSWPPMVLEFFSTMKPVAQISQQVFSFDCFIDARTQGQIESANENEQITFRIFYIKLILYAIAPLGIIIAASGFWMTYAKITKSSQNPRNRI